MGCNCAERGRGGHYGRPLAAGTLTILYPSDMISSEPPQCPPPHILQRIWECQCALTQTLPFDAHDADSVHSMIPGPRWSVFTFNGHGTPINTSNGIVSTESRSIHITNLTSRTTKAGLEGLLQSVSRPQRCSLSQKRYGKRISGSADATYTSVQEAEMAARAVDGQLLDGNRLKAKLDIKSQSVQLATERLHRVINSDVAQDGDEPLLPPPIVDGSSGKRRTSPKSVSP